MSRTAISFTKAISWWNRIRRSGKPGIILADELTGNLDSQSWKKHNGHADTAKCRAFAGANTPLINAGTLFRICVHPCLSVVPRKQTGSCHSHRQSKIFLLYTRGMITPIPECRWNPSNFLEIAMTLRCLNFTSRTRGLRASKK